MAFGLDLVGGMSVTLEISVPELVKSMARNPRDIRFKKPYEKALAIHNTKGGDFIDLFISEFKKYNGDALVVRELAITEIDELNKNSSNSQVANYLKAKVASSMEGVEQIMSKRINQFGVAQPNIQKENGTNRIYIELPGVQDESTVAEKLQSTANLQFFETYEREQIQMALSQASQLSTQPEIVEEEITDTTATDSLSIAKNDSAKKVENKPLTSLNKSTASLDTYLKPGQSVSIGFASLQDKEKVDKIIRRKDIQAVFPEDLKFMWSASEEKMSKSDKEDKLSTSTLLSPLKEFADNKPVALIKNTNPSPLFEFFPTGQ